MTRDGGGTWRPGRGRRGRRDPAVPGQAVEYDERGAAPGRPTSACPGTNRRGRGRVGSVTYVQRGGQVVADRDGLGVAFWDAASRTTPAVFEWCP
jgi:hypothetical protein